MLFENKCNFEIGAFVAGLDAGLVYNSFPKMGERWIPEDILWLRPAPRNLTENPSTVQWQHRVLAGATLLAASALWPLARRRPLSRAATALAAAVGAVAWMQVFIPCLNFILLFVRSIIIFFLSKKKGKWSFFYTGLLVIHVFR